MARLRFATPAWCRLALTGLPLFGVVGSYAAGPETLPPPQHIEASTIADKAVVPLSLDTVLRLAEDQNLSVAQARAKVDEAVAQQDLACRWLPDLYVGTAYYRHEGGIQLENGRLINSSTGAILSGAEVHGIFDPRDLAYQQVKAERNTWQQKGELSRITSEQLLEAAETYVDLLAAHAGKAINRELDHDMADLLKRTEDLAKVMPGPAEVEAARFRAEMEGRKQAIRHLDEQIAALSARLVYLLGLDPCSRVLPMDGDLVPIALIDPSLSTCDLVAQAQSHGPGVQELAAILGVIEDAMEKAKGPAKYLPVVELRLDEGLFGAGPGDDMKWANRFDGALQVRWNLKNLAMRCESSRMANAQRSQAHLAYEELQARLTAGVRAAHETVLAGGDQIDSSRKEIDFAREARKKSHERLDKAVEGSMTEVFNSLQTLGSAQLHYLTAVREYDKAQLRLLVLVGHPPAAAAPPCLTPADVGNAK